jgi:hypothetical protein
MNFYKLWEAIDHSRNEPVENNKYRISDTEFEGMSIGHCTQFALYCAEDVFHFNNDMTKNVAKNCIDLVKEYLKNQNPKTLIGRLEIAHDAAETNVDSMRWAVDLGPDHIPTMASAYYACLTASTAAGIAADVMYTKRGAALAASQAIDAISYSLWTSNKKIASVAAHSAIEKYRKVLARIRNESTHNSVVHYNEKEESRYLKAILDNLNNNEPIDIYRWLLYKDWLEERGDNGLILFHNNEFILNLPYQRETFKNEEKMSEWISENRRHLAEIINKLINNSRRKS